MGITYSVRPYCDADAPYYRAGCEECRANWRIRTAERTAALGKTVDGDAVRDHLLKLRRAGRRFAEVAAECGVSERVLFAIVSRCTRRPTRRTAERVLAVPVPAPALLSLADAAVRNSGGRGGTECWVAARPVRLYVLVLRELGMSWQDVAAAGTERLRAVWCREIEAGMLAEDAPAPRPIRVPEVTSLARGAQRWYAVERAQALLDVDLPALPLLPAGAVHAHGSRRRLQGLAVDGWPVAELARRLGVHQQYLQKLTSGQISYVFKARARAIADLAGELEYEPAALPSSAKVSRLAVRRIWLPLSAWHDDVVDDPYGLPDVHIDTEWVDEVAVLLATRGQLPVERLNDGERLAAVRALAGAGVSDEEIARILHWSGDDLKKGRAAVMGYRAYHMIAPGRESSRGDALSPERAAMRRHQGRAPVERPAALAA